MQTRIIFLLALLCAFTGYGQNQRMQSLFVSGGATTAVFRATSTATFAGGGLSSGGWTNSNHLRNAGAWVETSGGQTNIGATATRQSSPLLISGAFSFAPTLIATVGAVSQATNAYQWWTTNADFQVLFGGTPLDGARGQFDIKNTAATNITVTWPVSWNVAQAALITSFTATSNNITEVFWYYEGGSNRVRVATKEIVESFNAPTEGQVVAFHDAHSKTNVNVGIFSGALGADDTYNGDRITGRNGGETIAQWELVRMHSDGEFHLADADAAGEFPARGLAVAASSDGATITVLVQGTVRNDAWNWTVGGQLYLSATAGGLTQTAPSTSGHVVQPVGFAITADIAYFNFTGHYTTVQ